LIRFRQIFRRIRAEGLTTWLGPPHFSNAERHLGNAERILALQYWHFNNANQHLIIDNQHLIIENQHLIINNQHLIIENQHLIIENQHLIIENQYFSNAVFLTVFLSLDTKRDLDIVVFDWTDFSWSCYSFGGAWPASASGCFKKATQTPNARHPISNLFDKIWAGMAVDQNEILRINCCRLFEIVWILLKFPWVLLYLYNLVTNPLDARAFQ
jgi:hypothetical protein